MDIENVPVARKRANEPIDEEPVKRAKRAVTPIEDILKMMETRIPPKKPFGESQASNLMTLDAPDAPKPPKLEICEHRESSESPDAENVGVLARPKRTRKFVQPFSPIKNKRKKSAGSCQSERTSVSPKPDTTPVTTSAITSAIAYWPEKPEDNTPKRRGRKPKSTVTPATPIDPFPFSIPVLEPATSSSVTPMESISMMPVLEPATPISLDSSQPEPEKSKRRGRKPKSAITCRPTPATTPAIPSEPPTSSATPIEPSPTPATFEPFSTPVLEPSTSLSAHTSQPEPEKSKRRGRKPRSATSDEPTPASTPATLQPIALPLPKQPISSQSITDFVMNFDLKSVYPWMEVDNRLHEDRIALKKKLENFNRLIDGHSRK